VNALNFEATAVKPSADRTYKVAQH